MKKAYLTFLLGLSFSITQAQINSVDTVCLGGTVNFTTPVVANSYAWAASGVNVTPTGISGSAVLKRNNPTSSVSMQFDGGNYYGFVTNRNGGLTRLDFGPNPYNTPTQTDLGNFGILGDSTIGLDIVKDDGGNWQGFTTDGKNLIRFDFSNSLSNTPSASTTVISNFNYPYFITVRKYNNEWVGFVLNRRFSTMTRLEFGNSLANTPTPTDLSLSFGALNAPVNMVLSNYNGSWFALITNIGSGGGPGGGDKLVRLSFGTNLKNNSPTETNYNNPGNRLSNPRAISLITACDSMYALITNENNNKVTRIGFNNGNITSNTVYGEDLGTVGIPSSETNSLSPFWYNNVLNFLGSSFDSTIYMYTNVYTLPAGSATSYTTSSYSRTFGSGGTFDVTLHADQGNLSGSQSFCKKVVVLGSIKVAIKQSGDTLVASGTLCDNYEWKFNGVIIPGVNTQKYLPVEGFGVYTVTGSTAGCASTSNYQYWPTSVSNVLLSENVSISPNPSNGVFNISINGVKGAVSIQCYNVMGAMVAQYKTEANNNRLSTSLNLSDMPKGIYQVKIQAADGATIVKQILLQ